MSKGPSIVKVSSRRSLLSASELGASVTASARALGTSDSGALLQVKDKLKKLEGFADANNKLQEETQRLTKPEELMTFFSHLVDDAVGEVVDKTILDEQSTKANSSLSSLSDAPQMKIREQQELREQVTRLPITLFLFCDRDHFTVNAAGAPGTVSVAIAVGDVLLEWCENSLICPSYINLECPVKHDDRIVFHSDVHYQIGVQAPTCATDEPTFLNTGAEEVEFILESVTTKAQAIENVIKTISRYNRYFYFDKIARNSHRFVNDCMKSLGIKQHSEYATKLNRHAQQLMQRELTVQAAYPYHENIDTVVENLQAQGRLEQLPGVDLEYLLFVYCHQFHDGDGDACGRQGCRMNELRALLKGQIVPILV